MRTESERCAPKITGLAADVEQIIRQHARPEPLRQKVPTEPGVYRAVRPGELHGLTVQLDETGQWWPYPYSLSGWRASEMSLFELTAIPELELDVPEIRDPELRGAVEELAERLLSRFPEITDRARVKSFVLEYLRESY